MPSLQVRDVPEPLFQLLKQEAEREHRSMAQEAIFVLAKGLGVDLSAKERRKKLFDEFEKNPIRKKGPWLDPVKLMREDRDR